MIRKVYFEISKENVYGFYLEKNHDFNVDFELNWIFSTIKATHSTRQYTGMLYHFQQFTLYTSSFIRQRNNPNTKTTPHPHVARTPQNRRLIQSNSHSPHRAFIPPGGCGGALYIQIRLQTTHARSALDERERCATVLAACAVIHSLRLRSCVSVFVVAAV